MPTHAGEPRPLSFFGALVLLLGLSVWGTRIAAGSENVPLAPTAGLYVSAGAGSQYAGVGAQLSGVFPLVRSPSAWSSAWSLFAGLAMGGVHPSGDWKTYTNRRPWTLGHALSAGICVGNRHRLSVAGGYGSIATQPVPVEGAIVDMASLSGGFAEIGYEFVHPAGFFLRVLPLGIAHVTDSTIEPGSDRTLITRSVGVGWRIW